MAVSEKFMTIISEDIAKCNSEIERGDKRSRSILHDILISKYGKIIDGFKDDLLTMYYDDDGAYCLQNIEIMRQKLVLFQAMGYENLFSDNTGNSGLTINNTNSMDVNINISFPEVKAQIENMTALKEEEIQEILQKIDELEKIVSSRERKTKKWEQAKGIIKWIADKGVDVGIALLPLLLQIGQ